jgi:hypothetical protein
VTAWMARLRREGLAGAARVFVDGQERIHPVGPISSD